MPIEQLRTILFIALVVVSFLLWQTWLLDYGPKPPPPQETSRAVESTQPSTVPGQPAQASAPAPGADDVPSLPQIVDDSAPAPAAPGVVDTTVASGERISVKTPLYHVEIDPRGASLHRLDLLAYPISIEEPERPFTLLTDSRADTFVAQSGLLGSAAAPTHDQDFVARQTRYEMVEGVDTLDVSLTWRGADGFSAVKTYTFHRDSYVIDVRFDLTNESSESWSGRMYGQMKRKQVEPEGGLFRTYTYTGGVISGPEKNYEKITFDDMDDVALSRTAMGGWAAMIQHYFAGAWIPKPNEENFFYTKAPGNALYVLGVMTPTQAVAPGTTGSLSMQMYVGPKVQAYMAPVAEHLERTVDYGWLWLIAEPLFWLLDNIHSFVGNWGWAIIILTLLIKLAFFQLSAASYKSMAKMRKLQPRLVQLRERYGDDKQRLNQAMMELYKTEKINPLGGCLPILVQIPVFIALYWTLLESVELRQAGFVFWLEDLSVHDPYFVLPILMGITMILQQKLNPAPPDPMQAKIMMALPFVFTFLFLFFPSGLVLYWFVNNCLSIAQQWVITRKIVGPE